MNHLRFRYAWKASGRSLHELPWHSPYGSFGSWIGLAINVIALIAQFYVALFPIDSSPDAQVFFQDYLAAPIVIAFYVGYKVYESCKGRGFQLYNSIENMRLNEGLRSISAEEMEEKFAIENAKPKWKRWYGMVC